MVYVRDKYTRALLGEITEQQLCFLIDQLEEEYDRDTDYYINQATIDMFESRKADAELVNLLRNALGTRQDMEIEWSRW